MNKTETYIFFKLLMRHSIKLVIMMSGERTILKEIQLCEEWQNFTIVARGGGGSKYFHKLHTHQCILIFQIASYKSFHIFHRFGFV